MLQKLKPLPRSKTQEKYKDTGLPGVIAKTGRRHRKRSKAHRITAFTLSQRICITDFQSITTLRRQAEDDQLPRSAIVPRLIIVSSDYDPRPSPSPFLSVSVNLSSARKVEARLIPGNRQTDDLPETSGEKCRRRTRDVSFLVSDFLVRREET